MVKLNKNKKVLALVFAFALVVSALLPAFASATATNYGERWTNGRGTVSVTQNSGGKVIGSWSSEANSGGNTIISNGWSNFNLTNKTIGYNCGIFNNASGSNGCSYLMFYNWTSSPLTENYVIENWYNFSNNTGTRRGSVTTDGGTYDIFVEQKFGQPSIVGNSSNFTQYKSVRTSKNPLGSNRTINLNNHFNAWKSAGLASNPTWSYGVMAFEGYNNKGNGNLSVWANNF
jgi:endo-1,4-beta-xylanase